ncbi:MAG: hypothetical protein J1E95_10090 [Muribaculaceae bacterium]|nr:hypothetical protein [Muribaculaceae bacterium]
MEALSLQAYTPPQWVAVNHEGIPIFRRKILEGDMDAEYYYEELVSVITKEK